MKPRPFLYLPSGYKNRKNTVTEGIAKTGEISPQGIVTHRESWDGSVEGIVGKNAVRLIVEPDGRIRNMTYKEMLERGYVRKGKGPVGVRRPT